MNSDEFQELSNQNADNLSIPERHQVDISVQNNKELHELEKVRIETFQKAVKWGLVIFAILVGVAALLAVVYILILFCKNATETVKYFWHMPLMFLISATSVFFVIAKSAAKFSENADSGKSSGTASGDDPLSLGQIHELLKNIYDVLVKKE